MRELLSCLVCLCGVCGLTMMIAPDGGLKKYISLTLSLIVLCVIVSFLPKGCSGDLPSVDYNVTIEDKTDEIYSEIVKKTSEKIANTIKYELMSKYTLKEDEINVFVHTDDTDFQNVKISEIYIELYGLGNMAKLTRIEYYVTEKYSIPCSAVFIEE